MSNSGLDVSVIEALEDYSSVVLAEVIASRPGGIHTASEVFGASDVNIINDKSWVYCEDGSSKMVEPGEVEGYLKKGWAQTPAAFKKEEATNEEVEVPKEGSTEVVEEVVAEVATAEQKMTFLEEAKMIQDENEGKAFVSALVLLDGDGLNKSALAREADMSRPTAVKHFDTILEKYGKYCHKQDDDYFFNKEVQS